MPLEGEVLKCTSPCVKLLLGDAALRRMPLHGCFVDFRKAFDSVTWHSVEAALLFWHVPLTLRQSIMSIYRGHHVQVRCGSVCGQQIAVEKGVLSARQSLHCVERNEQQRVDRMRRAGRPASLDSKREDASGEAMFPILPYCCFNTHNALLLKKERRDKLAASSLFF